jgi:hypothetical protein
LISQVELDSMASDPDSSGEYTAGELKALLDAYACVRALQETAADPLTEPQAPRRAGLGTTVRLIDLDRALERVPTTLFVALELHAIKGLSLREQRRYTGSLTPRHRTVSNEACAGSPPSSMGKTTGTPWSIVAPSGSRISSRAGLPEPAVTSSSGLVEAKPVNCLTGKRWFKFMIATLAKAGSSPHGLSDRCCTEGSFDPSGYLIGAELDAALAARAARRIKDWARSALPPGHQAEGGFLLVPGE